MLIHTNDQLKNFYLKCQKHEIVAVDTEFYRVNTYYPKFCLLQMANKEETVLIDPFNKELDILNVHKVQFFITQSSRLDPSNRLLKWKLLFPKNINLPFFMTYFNIDPKPKNFIHPNGIKRINKVSYSIDNSLILIFKKLCDDKTIQLTNQKGAMNVSFKK